MWSDLPDTKDNKVRLLFYEVILSDREHLVPPIFIQYLPENFIRIFIKKESTVPGTPDSIEAYRKISPATSHLERPTANGPPRLWSQVPTQLCSQHGYSSLVTDGLETLRSDRVISDVCCAKRFLSNGS